MRVSRAALAAGWVSAAAILEAQQPVREQVSVARVEVTLHVTERSGAPIPGLSAADFRLFVDDQPAPIESVEWVSSTPAPAAAADEVAHAGVAPASPLPSGRLIVLVFQWEVAGQKQEGFLRMMRQALDFVDSLQPHDRVAVVTFGSRLWLRQDFVEERDKVRSAIRDVLRQEDARKPPGPDRISLAAGLSEDAERNATSIEKALLAIGRALRPLPGSKAVLFFGWGVGKWNALSRAGDYEMGAMSYSADYVAARDALAAAQAPVFSLDISGGSHQLEGGLQRLSFETGGFYVPTWQFPGWAMKTVADSIAGHYMLVFREPEAGPGLHTIRIETFRKNAVLLYRQAYED